MRWVFRPEFTPPSLGPDGVAGRAAKDLERSYLANGQPPARFPEHWNRPDVRGALYAAHWRTCAYCNKSLAEYSDSEVEHFRPKGSVKEDPGHGGYWWLAYEFSNYLLSCRSCNGSRTKGSRFPLRSPGSARVTFETRTQLPEEQRLLLDPAFDPVDEWLVAAEDGFVRPNSALDAIESERVWRVIELLRLNTRPELVRARIDLAHRCLRLLDQRDFAELRRLAMPLSAHSLVALSILTKYAPQERPTREQQFDDALMRLKDDLLQAIDIGTQDGLDAVKPLLVQLWFALATLWRHPSPRTEGDVEAYLERYSLRTFARPYFDKLGSRTGKP